MMAFTLAANSYLAAITVLNRMQLKADLTYLSRGTWLVEPY